MAGDVPPVSVPEPAIRTAFPVLFAVDFRCFISGETNAQNIGWQNQIALVKVAAGT
jgi:hypothetical protein